MPVYVDPLYPCGKRPNWPYTHNSHMFANTLDELHAMAYSIGLRREWFQDKRFPHYDLTPNKRKRALAAGVLPLSRQESVKMWREYGWVGKIADVELR